MKKLVTLLLISMMILTTTVFSFGAEVEENKPETLSLSGFSYEIHGKDIDETDDYTATLSYQQLDAEHIRVTIPIISGVLDKNINTILTYSSNNLYEGKLDDDTFLTLEMLENGKLILDVIKGNRVYAFGDNRRNPIENHIEELQNAETIKPEITPMYASGAVKTKSNSKVYTKMVWNPTRDNRLAIRVNTQGKQIGTTVQGVSVEGKVPSGYIVKSMNPTGANKDGALLSYIIGSVIKYIQLPPFPSAPIASCNGRSFKWTVNGVSYSWDKLADTSDSGNPDNPGAGFMFYLYLDNNTSTNPAPTGTISIRYRIVATGTFDATLSY